MKEQESNSGGHEATSYWLRKFIELGASILERIDLSLAVDANWILCDALEECDRIEIDLFGVLEPGVFHIDRLSAELPDFLRTAVASGVRAEAEDITDAIEHGIAERDYAVTQLKAPSKFTAAFANPKLQDAFLSISKKIDQHESYRRSLEEQTRELVALEKQELVDLSGDYSAAYDFIASPNVRSRVLRMHRELVVIEKEQLHLSGTILTRSIMEALLVSSLLEVGCKAESEYRNLVEERNVSRKTRQERTSMPIIERWDWDALVSVANRLGILSTKTLDICRRFNRYRNPVHPYYRFGEEASSVGFTLGKIAHRRVYSEVQLWRSRN